MHFLIWLKCHRDALYAVHVHVCVCACLTLLFHIRGPLPPSGHGDGGHCGKEEREAENGEERQQDQRDVEPAASLVVALGASVAAAPSASTVPAAPSASAIPTGWGVIPTRWGVIPTGGGSVGGRWGSIRWRGSRVAWSRGRVAWSGSRVAL